jgi:hypothetical protein
MTSLVSKSTDLDVLQISQKVIPRTIRASIQPLIELANEFI